MKFCLGAMWWPGGGGWELMKGNYLILLLIDIYCAKELFLMTIISNSNSKRTTCHWYKNQSVHTWEILGPLPKFFVLNIHLILWYWYIVSELSFGLVLIREYCRCEERSCSGTTFTKYIHYRFFFFCATLTIEVWEMSCLLDWLIDYRFWIIWYKSQ